MKKLLVSVLIFVGIIFITGCTNEYEEGYDDMDLLSYTYQFSGDSDNFSLDIGKVNFTDTEKEILIKGFKQKKKINNLSNVKFIISFDDKIWSTQETNQGQKLNKVNSIIKNIIFYERGQICSVDSGITCEETYFNQTTKETFKDKIEIKIEYCTNDNKCKTEILNLEYKN